MDFISLVSEEGLRNTARLPLKFRYFISLIKAKKPSEEGLRNTARLPLKFTGSLFQL